MSPARTTKQTVHRLARSMGGVLTLGLTLLSTSKVQAQQSAEETAAPPIPKTQASSSTAGAAQRGNQSASPHVTIDPVVLRMDFLQYGVGIDSLAQISPGAICPPEATVPCIIGSGVGLSAHAGKRTRGPWYWGFVYGFSKIETKSLLKLGVLQHLGAETRYYIDFRKRAEPFVWARLSGVVFGNEWSVSTGGAMLAVGAGTEIQLARSTLAAISIDYSPMLLAGWEDITGQVRPVGVAQYWGLHVHFEAHEALTPH